MQLTQTHPRIRAEGGERSAVQEATTSSSPLQLNLSLSAIWSMLFLAMLETRGRPSGYLP